MWLTQFALRRPVIVAMAFIGLSVYGLMSYFSLGVNLFPNVTFPIVAIEADYPGASPSEMEKLVVKPIEDQLVGIENLDRIVATAQDGTAIVIVRFKLDTDLNYAAIDVQNRVDTARIYMPSDLDPPVVSKFSTSSDPILTEALSSNKLSAAQLSDLVTNELVPALKTVPGVQDVSTSGDTAREIHVNPDLARLFGVNATLPDIDSAIAQNNVNLPGGRVDADQRETSVSIHADIEQPSDLLGLPLVIPGGAQQTLRLGDVATVSDSHVEQRAPTRYNGATAILLNVERQIDADELTTTQATRAKFHELVAQYPDIHFSEIDASADYTRASIDGVLQSLLEGIVLTAIVMLLFLHAWRNALVVMIAIPISLLGTFVAMRLFGFTIDLISMMGLGLTIGILVDDSIVVLENITRHRDLGEEPIEAAYNGRTEIGSAAVTITMVDVVVFLPIAFLSGIIGKYMHEFGVVIVVATLFSLLVSFTVTPLLAGRWSVKARSPGVPPWAHWFTQLFDRARYAYMSRILPWALAHRIVVVGACALLVASAIALVPLGFIGSEFIPSSDSGVVSGSLTYPVGTPLAVTEAGLERLTRQIMKVDAVDSVMSSAGSKPEGFSDIVGGYLGNLTVTLDKHRRRETDRVTTQLRTLGWVVPGATLDVSKEGSADPISFTISGDENKIAAAAEKLAVLIRRQPGTVNVETTAEYGSPRLTITVDPHRAAVLGVAPGVAALAARMAIGGDVPTKVRLASGLTDVRVQLPESQRNDVALVRQVLVRTASGTLVPLSSVADFTYGTAPSQIERQDRERVIRVTADLDLTDKSASLGKILDGVNKELNVPGFLPPGVHESAEGDTDYYNQTVKDMGFALLTSFSLVYMLMVVLYGSFVEPFVVMFSVPVALIGALYGLALRHQSLNLFSLIAIVMLFGLVAKNGILLVDYANQQLRRGMNVMEAMKAAAAIRFRPIVMTTFAMIFGMLPLSLGLTEGAEERASMGTVLIGGLLSSLLLTLVLVPIIYTWIMGRVEHGRTRRRARRAAPDGTGLSEYERPPVSTLSN
ncbi:MAG TPA: efflux RND transporter permease subunit [Candidatus Acidoferrales bacterium]|nr:efflux RND transporter permease subunit [Candidatus Acidoferrales bacterium]